MPYGTPISITAPERGYSNPPKVIPRTSDERGRRETRIPFPAVDHARSVYNKELALPVHYLCIDTPLRAHYKERYIRQRVVNPPPEGTEYAHPVQVHLEGELQRELRVGLVLVCWMPDYPAPFRLEISQGGLVNGIHVPHDHIGHPAEPPDLLSRSVGTDKDRIADAHDLFTEKPDIVHDTVRYDKNHTSHAIHPSRQKKMAK